MTTRSLIHDSGLLCFDDHYPIWTGPGFILSCKPVAFSWRVEMAELNDVHRLVRYFSLICFFMCEK